MEIEKLYYTKTEAIKILGIHSATFYKRTDVLRFKKLTMKQILKIKKTLPLNCK